MDVQVVLDALGDAPGGMSVDFVGGGDPSVGNGEDGEDWEEGDKLHDMSISINGYI